MHAVTLHVQRDRVHVSLAADANAFVDAWGRATLPLDYWRRDTLFSRNARAGWIQPDLQVLPVAESASAVTHTVTSPRPSHHLSHRGV